MSNNISKNKVLIVTGGSIEHDFLRSLILNEQYSVIIAADKGLLALDRLNILPNYILGDFDSAGSEILSKYREKSIPIMTFPSQKDMTDTELAFELALTKSLRLLILQELPGPAWIILWLILTFFMLHWKRKLMQKL